MNCFVVLFCFTSSVLVNSVQSDPDAHGGGLALATGPPSLGDSSVHYAYNRHSDYGYHHPEPLLHQVSYDYGHAHHDLVDHYGLIHPVHGYHGHEAHHVHDGYSQGYGHGHAETVKHGYKHTNHYGDHGYEHEIKHEHHHGYEHKPSGYVPAHGIAGLDHGVGYAVGHDAIGHFDHHTGPFGPFGFYANYYHD